MEKPQNCGIRPERRLRIERSLAYRSIRIIARWMDRYFLDPLVGLLPGAGDFLSSVFAVPFLYVSIFQVRSLPLTLAVIFNTLRDVALGLVPFWIGNVIDVFNRGYLQNFRLIVGFVEGDREIIGRVNRNAFRMALLIAACCAVICWLVRLGISVASGAGDFLGGLFS